VSTRTVLALATWVVATVAGCGGPVEVRDDAGVRADAATDGGIDAAVLDAAVLDADLVDAAGLDAGLEDAARADAAAEDAATDDAAIDDAAIDDASTPACGTVVAAEAVIASPHVTECSAVSYATNPPTSGPHYPRWPAYQTYTAPVAAGFRVHALEHGAVVITYRCDTPCDAELAALAAHLAARPPDPRCATTSTPHQIAIAPDPTLDVRFAAAAWGVSLRSDCFDLAALDAFLDAHTGHAPEDTCAPGTDIHDPRWAIPADCGS